MSELSQAIDEMRNMRESYDELANAADAYNTGKPALAGAISAKGIPASQSDSLVEMAQKVSQIPQEIYTAISNFEQEIAPMPYMWNVYAVARELMSANLPNYIPYYMAEYRQRYGTNSFFVAEYYRGYDSLELTGADGYLTHDGCFYTIANGVVTRTAPDGTVTTYEANTIVHQWLNDSNDTYANRWVAFFYLADYYTFTNANSAICPRRVALCGNCISFIVSGENRLNDVWVIGTLGHFEGGTTGDSWSPSQVIRNYTEHTSGYIYYNPSNVKSICLPDLTNMATEPIYFGSNNNTLLMLSLPNVRLSELSMLTMLNKAIGLNYTLISYAENINSTGSYDGIIPARGIYVVKGVKIINKKSSLGGNTVVWRYNYCSQLIMPDLVELRKTGGFSFALIGYNATEGNFTDNTLRKIYIPNYNCAEPIVNGNANRHFSVLEDVEVGAMEYDCNCSGWDASALLSDADKVAQINANIRNHIAAKVAESDGTRKFMIGNALFAMLEAETISAFEDKGWQVIGV